MKYKSEQEEFWAGDFGNLYINRNKGNKLLASNINFFHNALKNQKKIKSVIEFGANIGMNLKALGIMYPDLELNGIEINKKAFGELTKNKRIKKAYNCSINSFKTEEKYDLSLIKGVLIHINPTLLNEVYTKLYESSNKYILIAEYYNPSPISINYRGFEDKLFKRDFAGEFLDLFPKTTLIDYGFAYHRDNNFPQDDITWFLIEKE